MAFLFLDKRNVIIGSVVLAVIFSLGIIIGYYGRQMPDSSGSKGDLISEGIFTVFPILNCSNKMCKSLSSIFVTSMFFSLDHLSFLFSKLKRQQKTLTDIWSYVHCVANV